MVEMLGTRTILSPRDRGLDLALETAPRYVHLCEAEIVTRLGLWRPVGSIHVLPSDGVGRVLVEVENPYHETLQGMLEVKAGGKTLGEARVHAAPADVTLISVPVRVEDPSLALIPATVSFHTPDRLPFQTAAIWLHVP
jgi:hypothetical protein